MDTLEKADRPLLAERLGDTVHVSPLLGRISQLSGCTQVELGEWLLKCAVLRGASHYQRDFPANLPPDQLTVTNEELGVALCLGQHPYNSTFIRAAAQLLSSANTDAARLLDLAVAERVEPVMFQIATFAARFVSGAQPWAYLLEHLPNRLVCPPDALPHWSRFVSQTGVASFSGGPDIKWLHRLEPVG